MRLIVGGFTKLLNSEHFFVYLLLMVLITHGWSVLQKDFRADDYIQWGIFTSNDLLSEKGLIPSPASSASMTGAKSEPGWSYSVFNQFNFFKPPPGHLQSMKAYGALPWWTADDASLHLFRPVASITHWLDYQLWPVKATPMLLHGFLYYLILLVVLAALYQQYTGDKTIARLAIVFFALDISMQSPLTWIASRNVIIALLFSVACLIFFAKWRNTNRLAFLFASCAFLLLALLSAEAGIAAFAYLFAYALFIDQGTLPKRLLSLAPAATLIVVWRIVYQLAGYGAMNIGHYIDPVRDIKLFLTKIVVGVPLIMAEQITGVDSVDRLTSASTAAMFAVLALGLFILTIGVLWPLLRSSKQARFWLTGSIISALPMCAVHHTDGRIMGFVAIGFSALWAQFLVYYSRQAKEEIKGLHRICWRIASAIIVALHLVIPLFAILAVNVTGMAPKDEVAKDTFPLYDIGDAAKLADKHVLVINSPHPFLMMYAPYRMAFTQGQLPESIRLLAPGFSDIRVERLSDRVLRISPENGFLLTNHSEIPGEEGQLLHIAKLGRNLMGFFLRQDNTFSRGERFSFAELDLRVSAVSEGRPLVVEVELPKDVATGDYVWVNWNWQSKRFEDFQLPGIGEQVLIAGPFASKARE